MPFYWDFSRQIDRNKPRLEDDSQYHGIALLGRILRALVCALAMLVGWICLAAIAVIICLKIAGVI
jgi:hypothetical protein